MESSLEPHSSRGVPRYVRTIARVITSIRNILRKKEGTLRHEYQLVQGDSATGQAEFEQIHRHRHWLSPVTAPPLLLHIGHPLRGVSAIKNLYLELGWKSWVA